MVELQYCKSNTLPRKLPRKPFRNEKDLQRFVSNNTWILGDDVTIHAENRTCGNRKIPDIVAVDESKRELVVVELKNPTAKARTLGQIHEYCRIIFENPGTISGYIAQHQQDFKRKRSGSIGVRKSGLPKMMILAESLEDGLLDLVRYISAARWELVEVQRFRCEDSLIAMVKRTQPRRRAKGQPVPLHWAWNICEKVWGYSGEQIRAGEHLQEKVEDYAREKGWRLDHPRPVTDVWGIGEISWCRRNGREAFGIGPSEILRSSSIGFPARAWYLWFRLPAEPAKSVANACGLVPTYWDGKEYFYARCTRNVRLDRCQQLFERALRFK